MHRSIRVQIAGREYALRVTPETEAFTRRIASFVDRRIRAFKDAHPEQPELTAAVITSLAIAEELYTARQAHERAHEAMEEALEDLSAQLAEALAPQAGPDETSEDALEEPANTG